ncbi:MAG TPA: hypothetical protein VF532_00680 [Candidatus Angelobacter sp.]
MITAVFLAAQSPQRSAPSQANAFHEKAEDTLDCLDGSFLVSGNNAVAYWNQSLACRAMVRKLGRLATTDSEREIAKALLSYQVQISACDLGGHGDCPGANKARDEAIRIGNLRAPARAGG